MLHEWSRAESLAVANLTITIDDDVLQRARVRALEHRTSVNALLREYLEAYAGAGKRYEQVTKAILDLAESTESGSGGERWTRDELYDL